MCVIIGNPRCRVALFTGEEKMEKYYEKYVQDDMILGPPISIFVLGLLTSSLFLLLPF